MTCMHEVQDSGMGLRVADLECNILVIVVTGHACWNESDVHVVYHSQKLKTQAGNSNNIH